MFSPSDLLAGGFASERRSWDARRRQPAGVLADNNPADDAGRARHGATFVEKPRRRQARPAEQVNGFKKVSRAFRQIAKLNLIKTCF
jgi:hypothetical protein